MWVAVRTLQQAVNQRAPHLKEWVIVKYKSGQMRDAVMQIGLVLTIVSPVIRAGWKGCSLAIVDDTPCLQAVWGEWIIRFTPHPQNGTYRITSCRRINDDRHFNANDPRMVGTLPQQIGDILYPYR